MKTYRYWATDNTFYQFEKSGLQDTLSLDDWIAMNGTLGFVRIDKRSVQIYESMKLRFGNYKLYEMRNLSPIRTNSVRFLLNDSRDTLLVLERTNGPIYGLWDKLKMAYPLNNQLLHHPDIKKPTLDILQEYIKFFFNNVAGIHGPFHIVESLDDIKNRVNNYLNLNPHAKVDSPNSVEVWYPPYELHI